ncbi:MAG: HD domain-containing protein [Candidatus Omnitrophica bacterium]|nr:HD domain-containing protein [Candidatus Omnitrophota bacterium]
MTKLTRHIVTVTKLAMIIDSSDVCRRRHSYKVERHSILICRRLKLPLREIRIIKIASMLHDIGKIGIDLMIIKKADKLNADEWAQVRLHPGIGANIVAQLGFLEDAAPVIRYHHSRFGGGGYPDASRTGDDIPIGSRIISVADAYDAMINDRPYRKAMPGEAAIAELNRCSGSQFDPKIVDAFLSEIKA